MENPFVYLTLKTMRNQLRVRLRRLRQPRYAIGLVIGIAYFGLILGRPFIFGGRSRVPNVEEVTVNGGAFAPAIGSAILFILFVLPWIFPSKQKPALAVTQAEVQFLFTAPISRRRLIRYKLLRSLIGAAITSAFITILMSPESVTQALARFFGTTLIIALLNLHYTGIGLHRTPTSSPGGATLMRRWLPPAIALVLIALVGRDLMVRWPDVQRALEAGGNDVVPELARLVASGLTGIVLWPFRALVALPTAGSAWEFVLALPWPILAVAINYLWVVRTDVPFEEASAELADKIARVRREGFKALRQSKPAAANPLTLSPNGRIETAILWKNLTAMRRSLSWFILIPFAPFLTAIGIAIVFAGSGRASRADVLTVVSIAIAAGALLLGPLILRTDLRQDLPNLAILRTWPVRGAALVRGQLLAPALVLSVLVWMAVVSATLFSMLGSSELSMIERWSLMVAAVLIAPAVIVLQLLIQNGLAVTFPSWISTGPARGGLDVMGQRMLAMLVSMLGLMVGVLPAVILAGIVAVVIRVMTGTPPIILPGVIASVVLIGEAIVGSEIVGRILDRTDVSALDPTDA